MSKHKVTLWPSGKIIEVSSTTNLRKAILDSKVYLENHCGGHAVCGKCIIKISSGGENLTPIEFKEEQLLGNVFHLTKERLACQTKVTGNVTVDLSEHKEENSNHTPKVRRRKKIIPSEDVVFTKEDEPKREEKEGGKKRPKPFRFSKES